MADLGAAKNESGKWVPTVNGKPVGFGHYQTKKAALAAAQKFAANGVH
jgi:hypothetical protein